MRKKRDADPDFERASRAFITWWTATRTKELLTEEESWQGSLARIAFIKGYEAAMRRKERA